jgi:hypothetical protein
VLYRQHLSDMCAQMIIQRVQAPIEGLKERYPHPNRSGNYETIEKVLKDKALQFFAPSLSTGESVKITLNSDEIAVLNRHDDTKARQGGFQNLMARLQNKLNPKTNEIDLDAKDLEQIARYALDYSQGGWEDRLISIFSRTLGSKLGRK